MNRDKEGNMRRWVKDRQSLEAWGYNVYEMSRWHFRVACDWSPVIVDVWPSVRKYMVVGSSSALRYGDNIVDLFASIMQ